MSSDIRFGSKDLVSVKRALEQPSRCASNRNRRDLKYWKNMFFDDRSRKGGYAPLFILFVWQASVPRARPSLAIYASVLPPAATQSAIPPTLETFL